MDMSDIERSATAPSLTTGAAPDPDRWRELLGAVGVEIAMPLTGALERINALVASGKIDRTSLRALRDEVDAARHAAMVAQQLSRFASGSLRQSSERLPLSDTLEGVLRHRAAEIHARGFEVKPAFRAADVFVDASFLFSLLNALLDWSMQYGHSTIDLAIDVKPWPALARLKCRFSHRSAEHLDRALGPMPMPQLDSLSWRMVEQAASTMGLPLNRTLRGREVFVTLEFPRTVNDEMEGVSSIELDQGFSLSTNSRPLAGSHVLVIASRRDMRLRLHDAIRHMGLIVDLVASIDEATDFVREGLPHAIIVEGMLSGEGLNQLRAEICTEFAEFPFIEIAEEGSDFEMSSFGSDATMGRVRRDAIESALPSVLLFELSRVM
jgi:hypothetical protein